MHPTQSKFIETNRISLQASYVPKLCASTLTQNTKFYRPVFQALLRLLQFLHFHNTFSQKDELAMVGKFVTKLFSAFPQMKVPFTSFSVPFIRSFILPDVSHSHCLYNVQSTGQVTNVTQPYILTNCYSHQHCMLPGPGHKFLNPITTYGPLQRHFLLNWVTAAHLVLKRTCRCAV